MFESITLENFGVHRRLELPLSPGLTGILGANGSGKSTLLAALEALVTGVVPTAGVKDLNVNQVAALDEPSSISGVVVHNGKRLEITRGFRHAKSMIAIDGGTPLFGETKVNKAVMEVFGPTFDLLSDYVFVKQRSIYEIFDATPAVRAKALAQLFGTTAAERAWDALGKKLATITVPRKSESLDTLKRQAWDAYRKLEHLRTDKALYDDLKDYDRDADPNLATIRQWEGYLREDTERMRVLREHTESQKRLLGLMARVKGFADTHAELTERLTDSEAEAASAKIALATWKAYRRHCTTVTALEQRFAALEAEKVKHPEPASREHYIPSNDEVRLQLIDELSHSIHRDITLLETFEDGVAACPTCGTKTATLGDVIDAARRALPARQEKLIRMKELRAKDAEYEAALANWKHWKKAYKDKVAQYNRDVQALDGFGDEMPAGKTEDELYAVITEFEQLKGELRTVADQLAGVRKLHDEAFGSHKASGERLDAFRRASELRTTTEDDYEAARTQLDSTLEQFHEYGRIIGEIKAVKADLRAAQVMIAQLEKEAAESDRLGKLVGHLTAVRDVLHRDALPRRVAQGYLALVEDGVNRLLDRFSADFSVKAADDLAFMAHFHGGPAAGACQPAYRLSEGQKVLLAIAFRVEVNSLFASELGLLCLDEPTQYLDATNVDCLGPALDALCALAADRGLQCFLVTHEQRLARLFDEVVHLGNKP